MGNMDLWDFQDSKGFLSKSPINRYIKSHESKRAFIPLSMLSLRHSLNFSSQNKSRLSRFEFITETIFESHKYSYAFRPQTITIRTLTIYWIAIHASRSKAISIFQPCTPFSVRSFSKVACTSSILAYASNVRSVYGRNRVRMATDATHGYIPEISK